MTTIAKQSIKLELNPEEFEEKDGQDILRETFYLAIEGLTPVDGDANLTLLDKFFTMRFDETNEGGIAVTLTASDKRG